MKNMTKSGMIAALATPLFLVANASAVSAAAPDDGYTWSFQLRRVPAKSRLNLVASLVVLLVVGAYGGIW